MEKMRTLTRGEVELGFAASCVEAASRRLCCPYQEIVARMKSIGMIENFILPFYEQLHSESRENVTDTIVEYLKTHDTGQ